MAADIPEYDELKLRIQRGPDGSYQVVAFGPDESTGTETFSLPFDEARLDNFVLRVGRPRRGTRAYRSSQMRPSFLSQSIYTPLVRSLDLKSVRKPASSRCRFRSSGW